MGKMITKMFITGKVIIGSSENIVPTKIKFGSRSGKEVVLSAYQVEARTDEDTFSCIWRGVDMETAGRIYEDCGFLNQILAALSGTQIKGVTAYSEGNVSIMLESVLIETGGRVVDLLSGNPATPVYVKGAVAA